MTRESRYPRLSELGWFAATYFVSYAFLMAVDGGRDPKFASRWDAFTFSVFIIVVPSTFAAIMGYGIARWVKFGAGADIAANRWLAVVVATASGIGALGAFALSTMWPASDWSLYPWYYWVLGGGPLFLTILIRVATKRWVRARVPIG